MFQPVRGARSEGYGSAEGGYTHITVDFLAIPSSCREAYFEHVNAELAPALAKRIELGTLTNWSFFRRRVPAGSDTPYDHAAVTRYPTFRDVEKPLFSDPARAVSCTTSPELVKSELWSLEDILVIPSGP